MENRGSIQQAENERRCQIEGCNDVTVGARTSLCRKHRNNKYKQNYKKKKRKAQGTEENQGESLESQLAIEKYQLEQKYASMLQQVLVQKRLELLQSPSICNLLRIHQRNVRENKQKELMERRKAAQNERNSKIQQEKQMKSHPVPECSSSSTTCNSAATVKSTTAPTKVANSNKTLAKASKQSSRPPQGRNTNKNSKNRSNSNSSVESSINGLASNLKNTSSNVNELVGQPVYSSSGAWGLGEEKNEFCDLRQIPNFQQQQVAPQKMLHHPTQQALQQQKQQQQPSHTMQVQQPELLLQHYQQHSIPKQPLQHLQHQNLLELHQKQLHEQNEKHQQQLQQQQREQLLQQQQQQQLLQQRRLQQQLHIIQLQNSRKQQLQQQQQHHQQQQQQQQQQHQQKQQQLQGSGIQNQQQVQFHHHHHQQQQHQTLAPSLKNVSSTELLSQTLPSIQSSMSTLLVSQSLINTSNHEAISTAGTTRPSVLPRTALTNTQGRTQNGTSINHMVSNTPFVTSHRPIAPRLEGHPSVSNTLCNGGMPIITAIISAPLTQQIMPQNTSNVERNTLHVGTESNALSSINSFGNVLNNHYPLMPFNVQMDMNLLQGVGAQFSEQNVQCAPTQVRGRHMLLD